MNFLSRDFLYHLGLSKTTYRGIWNRSNIWRLGSLCLGFQPYFAWKRISDRGKLFNSIVLEFWTLDILSFEIVSYFGFRASNFCHFCVSAVKCPNPYLRKSA